MNLKPGKQYQLICGPDQATSSLRDGYLFVHKTELECQSSRRTVTGAWTPESWFDENGFFFLRDGGLFTVLESKGSIAKILGRVLGWINVSTTDSFHFVELADNEV